MSYDIVIGFKNGDRLKTNINCTLADWSAKVRGQVAGSPSAINAFYIDNGRWINISEVAFICLESEADLRK